MPLLPIFAGAATGFATMRADGTFILSADGTFGLDKNCCCPCAGCDAALIASSYAVAFAGGTDFNYSDTGYAADIGQTCGDPPITYATPRAHPAGTWSYVVRDYATVYGSPPFNCASDSYWGTSDTDGSLGFAKQTNGVYIYADVIASGHGGVLSGTTDCEWTVAVILGVCTPTGWSYMYFVYSKNNGNTPAGTYTFNPTVTANYSLTWVNLAKATYPATITLS